MFKNYLKVASRNIFQHKFFSLINILGLSIGMGSSILIFMFVKYELSYDKHFENSERVYRIVSEVTKSDGGKMVVPTSLSEIAHLMSKQLPEVESAFRLYGGEDYKVEVDGRFFPGRTFYYTDSSFLNILDFEILSGDAQKALTTPNAVIITEKAAKTFYGDEDPVGKTIIVEDEEYTVMALMKNIPPNTHLQFDIITPFISIDNLQGFFSNHGFDFPTFFLLKNNVDIKNYREKFEQFTKKVIERRFEEENMTGSFQIETRFQNLEEIHLSDDLEFDYHNHGSKRNIYIFSFLALFVLFVAIINFINLVTARSESRAKEIGVRKAMGAFKAQLRKQFIGEALIVSFISIIFALLFVELLIHPFSNIMNRELDHFTSIGTIILYLVVISLVIGIASGAYPAFYMARFNAVRVLKGLFYSGKGNSTLKVVLVVVQFSIAIFLITCLIIINAQLQYLSSKPLGFDKERLLAIKNLTPQLVDSYQSIKGELKKNPNITNMAACGSIPGRFRSVQNIYFEGEPTDNAIMIHENNVSADYIKTIGIEIAEGQGFSSENIAHEYTFIINETAKKRLGRDNIIGEEVNIWQWNGKIVGVMKDFHFSSLHNKIEPLVLMKRPDSLLYANFFIVKLKPGNIPKTIDFVQNTIESYDQSYPFQYTFVDQSFNSLYNDEKRTNKLVIFGSLLAIVLSILGLYALTSYNVRQKSKEIGIRKALGGSIGTITGMLVKDTLRWVLYVNIIAWPAAYFVMKNWLDNFAYSINMKVWMFLAGSIIAMIIAFLTVVFQSSRAARANPVEAIKYE